MKINWTLNQFLETHIKFSRGKKYFSYLNMFFIQLGKIEKLFKKWFKVTITLIKLNPINSRIKEDDIYESYDKYRPCIIKHIIDMDSWSKIF